ncbi:MAG: hypothetical protein Q8930_18015 [Bacillota bacterium]|nr:hypothetical protein [Bacillota bacterium]
MKRYILILLTIIFIAFSYIIINLFKKDENILLNDKGIKRSIIAGGLKGAKDFTEGDGDIYIAFSSRIQVIKSNGKSYMLLDDRSLDIKGIQFWEGKLYLLSKSSLMCLNLSDGSLKELVKDMPNYGDYGDGKLLIRNGTIYISIGAATNSGVVGDDNTWKDLYPFNCDIPPKDISINAVSGSKTGAFVPFNTKNVQGQKIAGHFPGNASVITYSINKGETSLFCWGIRNVKGMDCDSDGRIVASVGGMEPRGSRPVKGDVDYIYELKEGIWYGWPDYSGGDPINSPRFRGVNDGRIAFVLQKHPSNNPPAPLYQHKTLSSLSIVAVDRKGAIGDKDCIYFYDNKDNIIYGMNKKGIVESKLRLADGMRLSAMKASDNGMMILEQNEGYLVKLGAENEAIRKGSNIILVYSLVLILTSAAIIVWKSKK